MARFYDDLKRDGVAIDPELRKALGGAMVIDASEMSEYLYLNEGKGEWDLRKDFFNLAPPFETFFVECRAPQKILTESKGLVDWPSTLPRRWGVLFMAYETTTWSEVEKFKNYGDFLPSDTRWLIKAILFAETPYTANGKYNGKLREQFTWSIPVLPDGTQPEAEPHDRQFHFDYYGTKAHEPGDRKAPRMFEAAKLKSDSDPRFKPSATNPDVGTLEIDEDDFLTQAQTQTTGQVKGITSAWRSWHATDERTRIDESVDLDKWERVKREKVASHVSAMSLREDIQEMSASSALWFIMLEENHWLTLLVPCLMSICFLHVKGVTLTETAPPSKLVKRAQKERKEPPCTYHVLRIQPFRKILEREGGSAQTGVRRALHICRGTYHRYRDEEGHRFFGRGGDRMVWVPTHRRGSIERGLVDKSYKLEKPKEEPK